MKHGSRTLCGSLVWSERVCVFVEGGVLSVGQMEMWSRPGRAAHGSCKFEGEQRHACVEEHLGGGSTYLMWEEGGCGKEHVAGA